MAYYIFRFLGHDGRLSKNMYILTEYRKIGEDVAYSDVLSCVQVKIKILSILLKIKLPGKKGFSCKLEKTDSYRFVLCVCVSVCMCVCVCVV